MGSQDCPPRYHARFHGVYVGSSTGRRHSLIDRVPFLCWRLRCSSGRKCFSFDLRLHLWEQKSSLDGFLLRGSDVWIFVRSVGGRIRGPGSRLAMDTMGCTHLCCRLLHPDSLHERNVQEDHLATSSEESRHGWAVDRGKNLDTAYQLLRYDVAHSTCTHAVHRTNCGLRLFVQRLHIRTHVHLHHRITMGVRALLRLQYNGGESVLFRAYHWHSPSTVSTHPHRPLLLSASTSRIRSTLSTRNSVPTRTPSLPSHARMLRVTSSPIHFRMDFSAVNPLDLSNDIPGRDNAMQSYDLRACEPVHDRLLWSFIWRIGSRRRDDISLHILGCVSVVRPSTLRRTWGWVGDEHSGVCWLAHGSRTFPVFPIRRVDKESVEV